MTGSRARTRRCLLGFPVTSRSRTSVANTFSRGRPGRARSLSTRRRIAGRASLNASILPNFVSSRVSRHFGWYRYCLRPLASRPTAWRCPFGCGQIHTSVVGRRDRQRANSSEHVLVANPLAVGADVAEALAGSPSTNARHGVADVAEPCRLGRLRGIGWICHSRGRILLRQGSAPRDGSHRRRIELFSVLRLNDCRA